MGTFKLSSGFLAERMLATLNSCYGKGIMISSSLFSYLPSLRLNTSEYLYVAKQLHVSSFQNYLSKV